MDSIRKLVSGRLQVQPIGPHPDADSLSAFAENALPETERSRVLAHVADCPACRDTLFLSLPEEAAAQKILAVKSNRWVLALRWGTISALIIVIAGVFAARHELLRTPAQSAKLAPAPALPTKAKGTEAAPAKIAEETAPSDLERMRDALAAKKTVPAVHVPMPLRPEEKHMTAKLQGNLNFDKSGEVTISPPASSNALLDSRAVQNLPVQGRNAAEVDTLTAGTPANAVSPANAWQQKDEALAYGYVGGPIKQFRGYANLNGIVTDPSGAVVANAKVTTVGPIGSRTMTSDTHGKFFFDSLAPGTYSLRADAAGFKSLELKNVEVAANKPASLELKLALGAVAETVEIGGQSAPVEASGATLQTESVVANGRVNMAKAQRMKAGNIGGPIGGLAMPIFQWTLSADGAVQNSADGGKTWQTVPTAPKISFRALSAVGSSVWVGGTAGTLYHSADFGQHWTVVVPSANSRRLQSDVTRIEFLNALTGTVTTSNGETWSTTDGGSTWQRR